MPTDIPWDMIAPFEENAKQNHDQTLERLAERGGLSPTEIVAVMEGHRYRWIMERVHDRTEIVEWRKVLEYIRQHEGIQATEIEFLRWFYDYAKNGVDLEAAKHYFKQESKKTLPEQYEEVWILEERAKKGTST